MDATATIRVERMDIAGITYGARTLGFAMTLVRFLGRFMDFPEVLPRPIDSVKRLIRNAFPVGVVKAGIAEFQHAIFDRN